MKNLWFKLKTTLLPLLCMILAMAGCGNMPAEDVEKNLSVAVEILEILSEESANAEADAGLGEFAEDAFKEVVESVASEAEDVLIDPDGSYTTAEDVSLYLHIYGELPGNFITKKEAKALGWTGGSLEEYAPGMCIGGDYFGNYEGMLPKENSREYHECDIDTLGADSRGAKRLVYSNDGLIYYTEDHYESFELLYGDE